MLICGHHCRRIRFGNRFGNCCNQIDHYILIGLLDMLSQLLVGLDLDLARC